jgi:hypothetical protein
MRESAGYNTNVTQFSLTLWGGSLLDRATTSPAQTLAALRTSALKISRRAARGTPSKLSLNPTVNCFEGKSDIATVNFFQEMKNAGESDLHH